MRNRAALLMMLGAGTSAIVPVRVAARVVAILAAEANVAAVVVVAAAPGEPKPTSRKAKPNSWHVPDASRHGLLLSFSLSLMLCSQPPISLPISTSFSAHTP